MGQNRLETASWEKAPEPRCCSFLSCRPHAAGQGTRALHNCTVGLLCLWGEGAVSGWAVWGSFQ